MRSLPALFLCLTLPLSAAPPDGTAESLAPLLKRLDAEDFDEREAASRDLERWVDAAGAAGETLLLKAREGASPEVDSRVGAMLGAYERAREGRKYLGRFFDAAGLPSVAGKQRVVFNTGKGRRALDPRDVRYVRGWILSKTREELVLLEDDGVVRTRPRGGKGPHAVGRPGPGRYRKEDFAEECREWLRWRSAVELSRGEGDRIARTMTYGWWALQSGLDRLGAACFNQVQSDAAVLAAMYQNGAAAPPERWLASCLAPVLRRAARDSAVEGRSREELLERWKGIAALPKHPWSAEAAEFAASYASLLEEDAAWVEPSKEEFAKLDPAGRAKYWIHHLRDHREEPDSSAAMRWSTGVMKELASLGWEAVPELVARLEDWRPVRTIGFDDAGRPEPTWHLRCVADCCRDVLEEITGLDLAAWANVNNLPVGGPDWRRNLSGAARAWWSEAEGRTVEERLFEILLTNPGPAARALLKRDAEKHLPALIRAASIGLPRCSDLVRALVPHLHKEHREFLEGFLNIRNQFLVLLAARALWERCGSDSGAVKIAERVAEVGPKPPTLLNPWLEDSIALLADIRNDVAVEAVARFTRHPAPCARIAALQNASRIPDPRIARALASLLDDCDPDGTGLLGGGRYVNPRWCDRAAASLATILGGQVKFDIMASDRERDDALAEVKLWWEDNGEKVDWDALKQREK